MDKSYGFSKEKAKVFEKQKLNFPGNRYAGLQKQNHE
jgi:hypothetical protein